MTLGYICWAGTRGERLAAVLEQTLRSELLAIGVRIDLILSPGVPSADDGASASSLEDLRKADFAIAVLDPGAIRDARLGFDAGVISARPDPHPSQPRLVPLLMSDSRAALVRAPFQERECALLTLNGLGTLASAVLAWAATDTGSDIAASLALRLHDVLIPEWSRAQEQERADNDALLSATTLIADDYELYGLADSDDIHHIKLLQSSLQFPANNRLQTTLASELADISARFRECVALGAFGELAADWALEHLMVSANARLASITDGCLLLENRDLVRDFWMKFVFARARTSVWTTNFGQPGENMGGVEDQVLLAAQTAARDKNVEITRLFIYDPEMSEDEAKLRRKVMADQIAQTIDVRVITEIEFRLRADAEKAEERIGGKDFMIIDDAFIYVTQAEAADVSAELYRSDGDGQQRLAAARRFREVLTQWSDQITVENLQRFPGVLA